MKILILYFTKTGHTLEAANAVSEGIRSAGSEVNLVSVKDFSPAELADYDALIVGSPCWYGAYGGSGVANPLTQALDGIAPQALKGKRCGGISVHASWGGKQTIKTLGTLLKHKGCENYRPGPAAIAGTPLSTSKGPSVTPGDVKLFKAFGVAFAK